MVSLVSAIMHSSLAYVVTFAACKPQRPTWATSERRVGAAGNHAASATQSYAPLLSREPNFGALSGTSLTRNVHSVIVGGRLWAARFPESGEDRKADEAILVGQVAGGSYTKP